MSKFKELRKENVQFVKNMASEIKRICDQAVEHQHSYKEMKSSILGKMKSEESFRNSMALIEKSL